MARVGTYAMDITRLNGYGLAAAGLFPSDLRKVYGAEIIAPCSGEVIAAEGTLSNRRPLDRIAATEWAATSVPLLIDGRFLIKGESFTH